MLSLKVTASGKKHIMYSKSIINIGGNNIEIHINHSYQQPNCEDAGEVIYASNDEHVADVVSDSAVTIVVGGKIVATIGEGNREIEEFRNAALLSLWDMETGPDRFGTNTIRIAKDGQTAISF